MILPEFSIKRPVTAFMIIAALVVFGLIGFGRLGIALYPDVDMPMVSVTTTWQNARPEEIDNEITDELEDAVSSVSSIKHIYSQSSQGVSRITVEFELTKDVDVAAQEVRDKISARLYKIPDDADVPVIDKLDTNAQPIMWLAVTGQHAIEELTKVADEQIRVLLQKIEGVGEVRIGGGREKEIKIWLNRERLAAYHIGVDEVINAIRSQHIDIPAGKIESKEKEFLVRTIGELESADAFNNLIIAYREGVPIRLRLLGYAEAGREDSVAAAQFATQEGIYKNVGLGVAPRSGANNVAIAEKVRAMLPEIKQQLPEGMDIYIASDTTKFIEESISEVKFQLLLGSIMAALVILFFLQNIRTTLISALAIPTSIISTFALVYALDFTLNNMTMLALITAVGLVIDDAIVMVENIYRHRASLGKGSMAAALEGSSEVSFAIMSATLVLLGVFIPVAFMQGIVGRFFFQFAMTMAFSVACSLLVALTVVPMLSSRFLRLTTEDSFSAFRVFNKMMDLLTAFYRKLLSWSLKHRVTILLIALGAMIFGFFLFAHVGKEFVTSEDQSRILIRIETPLSYSIEKTEVIMNRLREKLREIPEVLHFFSIAGSGGANKGIAFITLVPKDQRELTQSDLQTVMRKMLKDFPDVTASVTDVSPMGGRSRNEDVQMVIQGPDIEDIDRYTKEIMARLSETPGYIGVTRDLEIGKPEVRVVIDREKAADAGVSVRSIGIAVGALLGGVDVADYKEGGKTYDIRVRLIYDQRILPQDVEKIWIRTAKGELVDISNFTKLEIGVGPNVINRRDRQRSATIYANLDGKLLGEALPEAKKMADGILPEGYAVNFTGRGETFVETGRYLLFAFALAVLLTYMVLGAQFESFIQPFAIMMGLPLSFIGAFGLLFILGNTFNLYSMIGLVLLVGLVTKNGILLIDYANQQRQKGADSINAFIEAGTTRLRPILMTAVSTVAGVIPVVIGLGIGSESRQPMAVVIAGGMLSSTVLTLVVVPVICSYLDQFSQWQVFEKMKARIMARDARRQGVGPQ